MEPKIWTREEVIDLIADEIQACQASHNTEDRRSRNIAECVYDALDNDSLILLQP